MNSDEDIPLARRKRSKQSSALADEDIPLAKRKLSKRSSVIKTDISTEKNQAPASLKTEEAKPLIERKASRKASTASKRKSSKAVGVTPSKTKLKKEEPSPAKSTKSSQGDDEQNFEWWKQQDLDDSIKWTTFHHAGVLFPPDYIPHNIPIKHNGISIKLPKEAEEVATFFAAVIGTDWEQNTIFRKNFFADFTTLLAEIGFAHKFRQLEELDFGDIFSHLQADKERKKNLTKEEKKVLKEEKLKAEEEFMCALVDGRKEKVGNFRVEPPGLFRGRGAHPKAGCLKKRVYSEQVVLNLSKDAPIPKPPAGHQWGGIVNDNTVTWLAYWKENINDNFKYVWLSANSSWKGQSDFKKFEKARELKNHIERIRKEYVKELKSKELEAKQRATAMYLIDRFALRAGNEKGDDEADTVGCCSLRVEHITCVEPNTIVFDFLGKDSIRYYNEVTVDGQVFKNLKEFALKSEDSLLFDELSVALLNKHLNSLMPGLSAKVFRTFNASFVFQEQVKFTPKEGTSAEKMLAFNRANRQVAVLCNHQRSVPKTHGTQMERLTDKVKAIKYERKQLKAQIMELDKKKAKEMPELKEVESDLEDEWIVEYEKELAEREKEKDAKKLIKMNEKLKADGKETLNELPQTRTQKQPDLENCLKKLATLNERLIAAKSQLIDKDENKTTALSTSKINYIDPRISTAWCHQHGVPLEKVFNKTLRDKFKWAMEVDASWHF